MNAWKTLVAGATLLGILVLAPRPAAAQREIYRDELHGAELDFNFDLIGGWYNSNNSWFGRSAQLLGANTDHWTEVGMEPGLTYQRSLGRGTLFGAVSGVYTSTAGNDASGLTVGLDNASEFTLELGNVGWRIDDVFDSLDNDTFTITVGRQDYTIGSGLLIDDGAADGGERGGWYLAMRKAFTESVVASLDSEKWLFELFRLENHPRAGGNLGEAWGANVEYKFGDEAKVGTTYMGVDSNLPGAVNLDVYSVRGNWRGESGFGLAGEYVDESSSQIKSKGYYGEVSYAAKGAWSPVYSYRYAHFDGDNLATPGVNERFHEIAYGFTDWGTWYQGEITGEYALGNGNLISSLLRAQLHPNENVVINAMLYHFTLDRPASFAVASSDWGNEINFTIEWEVNEHVTVIGVVAELFPGDGAKQFVRSGPADDWAHAMLYVAYHL